MSKKQRAYARGRVEGIRESGWECGDCGNFYDATAQYCPNQLLDAALLAQEREDTRRSMTKPARQSENGQDTYDMFGYLSPERTASGQVIVIGPFTTREEAEDAASGQPVVLMPVKARKRVKNTRDTHQDGADDQSAERGPRVHLVNCPCEQGSCCPWMGDCDCQCMCDFIAEVEERVRDEYAPSENDANEGYRKGYETAAAELASKHAGGDTLLRLGYEQALKEVINESQGDPANALTVAVELLERLSKYSS